MSRNKQKQNTVWCELNDEPCIHSSPDGLENCLYCEKYTFSKYMDYTFKQEAKEEVYR